jgi:multiple sugar transport system ATP-binding protein
VGTPLEVYGNPASKFVAGFIGAPSMNFLDVAIREKGGKCRAENASLNLPVPASRISALSELGAEIVIEVRTGNEGLTVARIDPQTSLANGDKVQLSVPPEQLHFFDPATELAIR